MNERTKGHGSQKKFLKKFLGISTEEICNKLHEKFVIILRNITGHLVNKIEQENR